jgi:cystathionine gamma-synthase
MKPSTRAARSPGQPDATFGGLVPPIVPSTTYVRAADGSYPGGHSYSRDQNPTAEPAEQLLATLEEGQEAKVFASGMAAATALFDALVPGTQVIAPTNMYWTIQRWLQEEAARDRIRLRLIDDVRPEDWKAALTDPGPHLLWLETPANPMGHITDIAAVSTVARDHGALVAVDNTTPTPVHTRPLTLGADVVFHSATKQLNGHGDVLAGALVVAEKSELWERVGYQRGYRGAVLGPFEAWLLHRGMRSLYVRVPRSSASALAIATALDEHPAVGQVLYAGMEDHPGHSVAREQMEGGFGMLVSIRIRGGAETARRVMTSLELFADATSLGSVESLVEHRSRVEGPDSPVPDDLLRLSVGLEDPDDLIADLRQALDA